MEKTKIFVAFLVAFWKWLTTPFKRFWERLEAGARMVRYCRLVANTRAQEGMGAGVIGVLVGLMVAMLIGIIIIVNLIGSQTPDATWTKKANDTWTSLQANIWIALTLCVIVPIIVGAVVVMSYVRRL